MLRLRALAFLVVLGLVPMASSAQEYPARAIRLVVAFPPGGGTDILGRALATELADLLHRPVIVENKPGANGIVGTAYVARSPADGLTMLIVPAGYAANAALYKSLPYDPKDLAPVSQLASGPLVLVVHPGLGVKSVRELIALARSKPGELSVGNAGIGSLPHLSGELFGSLAQVKMTAVPYKGAGAATTDLLSGRVPVYFMNILQALPYIKDGRVRALGVTCLEPTPIAPGLPPVAADLPGFDMDNWYGLLAPAGTPAATVNGLYRAVVTALNREAVKKKLYENGATVVASPPAEFAALLARETAKYNRVIEFAGIRNAI